MGGNGEGRAGVKDCGSHVHRGRREAGMTFGIRESYWGHGSIREWISALCSL